MNVADLLRSAARSRPDHAALEFEGTVIGYHDLDRLTDRFANALTGLGIRRKSVVALFLDSGPELVIAYLGALKAGVVANVLDGELRPEDVRGLVADSGARLLVVDPRRRAALAPVRDELGVSHILVTERPAPEGGELSWDATLEGAADRFVGLDPPPEAIATLLSTSGTTGRPKGVMLSHLNIVDNAVQFAQVHFDPADRLLIAAPLSHGWGLINGLLGMFAVGGTVILPRRFRPEPVLDLIEAARPTLILGVPAMFRELDAFPGRADRDFSCLRAVLSAAGPMPSTLIESLRADWPVGYCESYGLTETSSVLTTTPPEANRTGSCGRAMGDTAVKVVGPDGEELPPGAVGELWACGTAIAAGYFQRPEDTAAVFLPDGWLRTGDLARIDAHGYVFLVDRLKDMIDVGGEKVLPGAVEEALRQHPAVADAAVVGLPDPALGEVAKAYLVLNPGHDLTADAAIAFLRPSLAASQLPRAVEFIPAIPRSPSGEALRRLLR